MESGINAIISTPFPCFAALHTGYKMGASSPDGMKWNLGKMQQRHR